MTGICLILVFFIDRHYIGIATIFNLFGAGFVGQVTMDVLALIFQNEPLWTRIVLLLFGLVLLCFGASLYFTADLGVSAYDAMALILSKNTPVTFRVYRISTDVICVIVGFIFKATVGIGTVLTAFFMGPVIQWFIDHVAIPILDGKKR